MDWNQRFLQALRDSRPSYDEPPDWRAALALYSGLSEQGQTALDLAIVQMIDQDYRNPYSSTESQPFDDVLTTLPAGMSPDDLLCIEAAVLVAAERGLGQALFPFNRLLRAPRWHAMFPRLLWLSGEATGAQRKLSATRAGRYLGAWLGMALGDALGATTATALAVAESILEAPQGDMEAVGRHLTAGFDSNPPDGGDGALMRTLPTAMAYGSQTRQAIQIARMTHPHPESEAAVAVYHAMVHALLEGAAKEAAFAAGLEQAGILKDRLEGLPTMVECGIKSTGDVVDTLQATIWSFLTTDTLEATILRAVNLGGEAHTIGALAGGLAGAFAGPLAAPRRWSIALRGRERLELAAERLYLISYIE